MKMKKPVISAIIAVTQSKWIRPALMTLALLGAGFITSATAQASSTSTLKSVLDHYISIQSALARDSMENVSASAKTVAAVVHSDETKSVPSAIAEQAEALAKARNIAGARKAFKPLSEALIAYLKVNAAPPGTYYEVYCPIDKASWLQAGETVKNPYLGPRSATPTWGWACPGVVREKFVGPSGNG